MEIHIEVAEARDGFGLLLAAEVSDIRGNVSFAVADKLKLGELYRKLTTAVNEHLAENIAKVEHAFFSPPRNCDRIESAHNRELAAKDDERLTIVANYENVISEKDAEIAELQRRLDIAESALTELQTRLVSSVHDGTMNPYEALEITERAIAAISEKGGAK